MYVCTKANNGVFTWDEITLNRGGDISLGLTGASAGGITKIKTVDENGKTTEWENATSYNEIDGVGSQ